MSNQIRLIGIGIVTALMCGVIQAKQVSHAGDFAEQTQPLSPSVLATILLRGQSLELALLWGAAPGWFLEGSHRSANGGAAEGRYTATLEYGGRQFGFSYEPTQRSLLVQGKSVSLPDGANVVWLI